MTMTGNAERERNVRKKCAEPPNPEIDIGAYLMHAMFSSFVGLLFLFTPTASFAHTGIGDTRGFAHGFVHPLTGFDHVLAMVAVGLFAARLSGRALCLVPATFVSVMALAGALGAAGNPIPFVEVAIAISVIALGLAVAIELKVPAPPAMALVGFFAIFHGYAHGTELPEASSGLAYGVGFIFATASLHAIGIGIGLLLGRAAKIENARILQATGAVISIAGAGILLQLF